MKDLFEGSGFSPEQVETLVSALTKLGFQSGADAAAQSAVDVHGIPIDELCKEEVAKYECHPMDLWVRLEQWTARNEMATGLDQFLLRHLGFFNVEPTSPGYMVRLRLPACVIRGDQMEALAGIADRYAAGYCHITTRGNIQLREIQPKNVLKVLQALTDAGLSCQGSGADSARNITTSPTAGFDAQEIVNLAPYAQRLSNAILNTRELRALPRKFNISFDNGGAISAVSDSNDICFQAVEIAADNQSSAEVYCRISVGGISGHQDLARDTGYVCKPEESVQAAIAMLNVFVRHADRTNRKRARLKYLLDQQGINWFVDQTQAELAALESGFQLTELSSDSDMPRPPVDRQAHIGVHQQDEPGLRYLGVALEMGRLASDQMRTLGSIARQDGCNELRLTVWQNLLIPSLPDDSMASAISRVQENGMKTEATAFAAGAVACTGKSACKLGLASTKENGLALVRHLEERFVLDRPLNIHLTGCPNSCAQHFIGDIGLAGATMPDGGEGYYLVLGGGSDQHKRVGRPTAGPFPASRLNPVVTQIMAGYLADRHGNESFFDYMGRVPDSALPSLINTELLTA